MSRRFLHLFVTSLLTACNTLAIEPETFVAGRLGQPYAQTFLILKAKTPINGVSLVSGRLPPGLKLETKVRRDAFSVVGTPTEIGEFKFRLYISSYGTNYPGRTYENDFKIEISP